MLPPCRDKNFSDPNYKPKDTPKSYHAKTVNHFKIGRFLAILWRFSQKNRVYQNETFPGVGEFDAIVFNMEDTLVKNNH